MGRGREPEEIRFRIQGAPTRTVARRLRAAFKYAVFRCLHLLERYREPAPIPTARRESIVAHLHSESRREENWHDRVRVFHTVTFAQSPPIGGAIGGNREPLQVERHIGGHGETRSVAWAWSALRIYYRYLRLDTLALITCGYDRLPCSSMSIYLAIRYSPGATESDMSTTGVATASSRRC